MELQWIPVRNKRRRFNTGSPAAAGTGQINFSSLNVDEKLSHIVDKLNSLERSNNEIMKFSQQLNSLKVKVDSAEQRTVNHELFLKVLAYKSIDIEARSRRCNLIFHGLSESTNENLSDEMRNFMWYEMGLTYDDFYIHRVHRLGSLYKAKQKNGTENPKRPVIIAFQDYHSTEKILSSSYMLRGSGFSVTRDYPREIVSARQRLMQRYRTEKQNGSKVSIEYPARLVVNGRTVADEFPDWYQALNYDRFQLSCGNYSPPNIPQRVNETQTMQSTSQQTTTIPARPPAANPQLTVTSGPVVTSVPVVPPVVSVSYARVAASVAQQQQHRPPNVSANIQALTISTFSTTRPITAPRYTANSAASQGRQSGSTNTTTTTFPTTNTTNFTTNTGTYNQSMNASGNGPRPRDNQTYTNL